MAYSVQTFNIMWRRGCLFRIFMCSGLGHLILRHNLFFPNLGNDLVHALLLSCSSSHHDPISDLERRLDRIELESDFLLSKTEVQTMLACSYLGPCIYLLQ